MIHDFEIGDIVLNDFREQYDRETHEGVVTEIDEETAKYKVVLLGKDGNGYYDAGVFEWRSAGMLTATGKRIEDLKTLYAK